MDQVNLLCDYLHLNILTLSVKPAAHVHPPDMKVRSQRQISKHLRGLDSPQAISLRMPITRVQSFT